MIKAANRATAAMMSCSLDSEDVIIASLREEVTCLQSALMQGQGASAALCASRRSQLSPNNASEIPQCGLPARLSLQITKQPLFGDCSPELNARSHVNIVSEPEEQELALMGAKVSLADGSVHPVTVMLWACWENFGVLQNLRVVIVVELGLLAPPRHVSLLAWQPSAVGKAGAQSGMA